MRMQDMDSYLEEKGFEVDRRHERVDGKSYYRFAIRKDGCSLTRNFEYPATDDNHLKNLKKEQFLDEILISWNSFFTPSPFRSR